MKSLSLINIHRYHLVYLAEHLYMAGQYDRLHWLLTHSSAWLNAKFERLGSDSFFGADVELAIDRFCDVSSNEIIELAQLYMLMNLIRYRNKSQTDDDLKLMLWSGQVEKAVNYARSRSAPYEKFTTLAEIYQTLITMKQPHEFLQDELIQSALEVPYSYQRVQALSTLKAVFYNASCYIDLLSLRDEIEKTILQLGPSENKNEAIALCAMSQALYGDVNAAKSRLPQLAGSFWQIEIMTALGVSYAQKGKFKESTQLFDDAWDLAKQIDDVFMRFGACCDLVVNQQPYASDVLSRVKILLDDALEIEAIGTRVSVLSLIASTLAKLEEFEKSIKILNTIRDAGLRSTTLKDIALAFANNNKLNRALEFAYDIPKADTRAETLRTIAVIQAEKGYLQSAKDIHQQAREIIAISDPSLLKRRVEAYCAVARVLHGQNLDDSVYQLLKKAQTTTQQIETNHQNAMSCYKIIIQTLAQTNNYPQAMSVIDNLPEESWRDELLCSLVKGLALNRMLVEAESISTELRYPTNRAAAYCYISQAYLQTKQFDLADVWFQKALQTEDISTQNRDLFKQLAQENRLGGLPSDISTKLSSARGEIVITMCLLAMVSDLSKKVPCLQRAIELSLDVDYLAFSAKGFPVLIRILFELNELDEINNLLEQWTQLLADADEASRDKGRSALSKAFTELARYEEALQIYQTIQAHELQLDVLCHMSIHLLQHQEFKTAFEFISDMGIDGFIYALINWCENDTIINVRQLVYAIVKIVEWERPDWQIDL